MARSESTWENKRLSWLSRRRRLKPLGRWCEISVNCHCNYYITVEVLIARHCYYYGTSASEKEMIFCEHTEGLAPLARFITVMEAWSERGISIASGIICIDFSNHSRSRHPMMTFLFTGLRPNLDADKSKMAGGFRGEAAPVFQE
jgi:hypothetical protein